MALREELGEFFYDDDLIVGLEIFRDWLEDNRADQRLISEVNKQIEEVPAKNISIKEIIDSWTEPLGRSLGIIMHVVILFLFYYMGYFTAQSDLGLQFSPGSDFAGNFAMFAVVYFISKMALGYIIDMAEYSYTAYLNRQAVTQ